MFYKDFKNHIELINSSGFTWQNVEKAYARGIEIEFKKIITRQLDIRANVALIQSASEFIHSRLQVKEGIKEYIPLDTIKRNMFGQSPYVVNAMITYIPERIGMTISASYNVQGPRLTIASQVNEIPDIYELPRNMIDIKATKIINKHFSLSLAVRDLLNSSINRSYKYPEKWIVYDKYTYGTNYIFSILYKL
jgi:outer membrane receptor for ferrienterochelin and colicin